MKKLLMLYIILNLLSGTASAFWGGDCIQISDGKVSASWGGDCCPNLILQEGATGPVVTITERLLSLLIKPSAGELLLYSKYYNHHDDYPVSAERVRVLNLWLLESSLIDP